MSILTELLHGKITWDEAKTKAEGWANAVATKQPDLAAAVSEELSVVKQGASDAISLAETALADHSAELTAAVETALEAMMAKATGGASIPFNAVMDSFVTRSVGLVVKAATTWGLEARSKLNAPPT